MLVYQARMFKVILSVYAHTHIRLYLFPYTFCKEKDLALLTLVQLLWERQASLRRKKGGLKLASKELLFHLGVSILSSPSSELLIIHKCHPAVLPLATLYVPSFRLFFFFLFSSFPEPYSFLFGEYNFSALRFSDFSLWLLWQQFDFSFSFCTLILISCMKLDKTT